MAEMPRKAFVCGHPVGHSRSPLIHTHWLAEHGIDGSYDSVDVAPAAFAEFIANLGRDGFCGGNVTIPHKEAAWRLAQCRDDAAEQIGAVNTLWFENGRLCGTNTDWQGFAGNLDATATGWDNGGTAVLLGAGGAARAVVYALVRRGFTQVRVVNRTLSRAEALAGHFGPAVSAHSWSSLANLLNDCDLLVNSTALGLVGDESAAPDLAALPDHAVVTDIVYVPLETPLLRAARARGLAVVDGLGMLLHQAVPGFELWFGVRPAVTRQLRDLVIADLEAQP
ncbi:shikimate dehydrogenase [Mesorhizobium xinjiangense]|uniref:shikimate dehydrogenase n=1 Tax=Mesorhizobium xinjiangense TaxID=2678685 RepID=UPI0012EE1DC7|nr:shikimate dehydrogenase [Mesorhizobium xinjiangense]